MAALKDKKDRCEQNRGSEKMFREQEYFQQIDDYNRVFQSLDANTLNLFPL